MQHISGGQSLRWTGFQLLRLAHVVVQHASRKDKKCPRKLSACRHSLWAHRAVTCDISCKHPLDTKWPKAKPVSAYLSAQSKRWSSQILTLAAFIQTPSESISGKNFNKHTWWWWKYRRVRKRDGSERLKPAPPASSPHAAGHRFTARGSEPKTVAAVPQHPTLQCPHPRRYPPKLPGCRQSQVWLQATNSMALKPPSGLNGLITSDKGRYMLPGSFSYEQT